MSAELDADEIDGAGDAGDDAVGFLADHDVFDVQPGLTEGLTEAQTLLADLVSIPSPSGEEAAAAERLAAFFEAHDREVWIDEAGYARPPADDPPLLVLLRRPLLHQVALNLSESRLLRSGRIVPVGP